MSSSHSQPPCRLWIVRHGQTDWNVQGRIQGHQFTPLNQAGRQQARDLARYFADKPFTAIYASDLPRAAETAALINEGRGLPLHTDARLRERFFGEHEGKTSAEIHALHTPQRLGRGDLADPTGIPGIETDDELWSRARAALFDIAHRHTGEDVLVVSHGGVIAHLIFRTLGIPQGTPRRFSLANGITTIVHFQDDELVLLSMVDMALITEGRITVDTAHAPKPV